MKQVKQKKEAKAPLRESKGIFIAGLVLCLVFGFMLICNITIIIKGTTNPYRPPSVFSVTPMVVLSGSMSGEQPGHIEVGDLIFVSRAEAEELEVGDVISFMEGQVVVTHRITEIVEDENGLSFITKGDANNAADTRPVKESQLVGIYRGRIPGMGNLAMFMQTPLGMLIFIGVPLLGFIGYDIFRRQRIHAMEAEKRRKLERELRRMRKQLEEEEDFDYSRL